MSSHSSKPDSNAPRVCLISKPEETTRKIIEIYARDGDERTVRIIGEPNVQTIRENFPNHTIERVGNETFIGPFGG